MDPSMFVETTLEEQESCEENADINCFLSDAESNINELKKKFNDIDDIIIESRKMMNSLSEKLDLTRSVIQAEDERHKREMAEKLNFKPGSGLYPGTPPKSNLCYTNYGTSSPIFSNIEGKSYLDTRSKVAVEAISKALGPLSPEQLTRFLDEVRRKQNVMYIVRQFTNDVDSLLQQLVWVKDALDDRYKEYVSKPGNRPADFDRRLFKRLESLIENIELSIQHQAEIENTRRNFGVMDDYGATAKEEKLGINEAVDYVQQNVAEVRDDFHKMNSLIRELFNVKNEMEQKMERADFMLKHVERLKQEKEKEDLEKSMSDIREGIVEDKISEMANNAISITEGPLNSKSFKEFLLDKVWGKPKPAVLPVVRNYTTEIPELVQQLKRLKTNLNRAHMLYKEQRKLDMNLNNRIDRLIKNIMKELEIESKEGRYQTAITMYATPEKPDKRQLSY